MKLTAGQKDKVERRKIATRLKLLADDVHRITKQLEYILGAQLSIAKVLAPIIHDLRATPAIEMLHEHDVEVMDELTRKANENGIDRNT